MLPDLIANPLLLGALQAGAAAVLALLVLIVVRQSVLRHAPAPPGRQNLEWDVLRALPRGFIQIVLVGTVLGLVLQRALWVGGVVLAGMVVVAATIATRRAAGIPGTFRVALISIGCGAGIVIALMTWLGVLRPTLASVIPIGSMMIANAMQSCGQALDRFHGDVTAHAGEIEAGLVLGAAPAATVAPYMQAAVRASLIPRIDALRSLGIVWIPGVMAGMVLSGSDPLYAALYQFVIMALLFSAGSLTVVLTTLLIQERIFSAAEQLVWPTTKADGKG